MSGKSRREGSCFPRGTLMIITVLLVGTLTYSIKKKIDIQLSYYVALGIKALTNNI